MGIGNGKNPSMPAVLSTTLLGINEAYVEETDVSIIRRVWVT